ncbi:MAG: stage II sporulation protein M [Luteimonas sp.]
MKQVDFVARHEAEWVAFEDWLEQRSRLPRAARGRVWNGLRDEQMPEGYRRLCQQLAIARRRGYSAAVTVRLQDLMQRGHNALYRPPTPRWSRVPRFLLSDFPRLVRSQRGCVCAALALFALPMLGMFAALHWFPELIRGVFDTQQLAELERMYDPADAVGKLGRDRETDLAMFGYYVLNNVSIGFRTFASGLLAGIGTILALLVNGVMIGGVAGHLQGIGHGDPFWRFVVGHSAFELTAIVIAGAAGLRLGLDMVAPGRRRRVDALIDGGKIGAQLCLGVLAMLILAAFVEAFWSSIVWIPRAVKFGVGGMLWLIVLTWLWRGGRGTDAA